MRTRCALLVIAALAAGCGGDDPHASLSVHAASGLADAPVTVAVHTKSAATLHASWVEFDGHVWRSSVPLRAGTTTLRGIDGMRFLWALRPNVPPFKDPFFTPPLDRPSRLTLSVVEGGKTVARAAVPRRIRIPAVRFRHLTVRTDGLEGYLFTPPVRGRRPAVLVFGGSDGGDSMVAVAALLAAHGYPALSLAYFDARGLPRELVRIPLEYFARAVRMLRRQPGVDPAHVVVMGTSRGGEASLLLASTFPRLIHGAIGLVPNSSVFPSSVAARPSWTLRGKPILPQPIKVERISGPVLTVGAGDDEEWPSAEFVRQIEHRLRSHRFRFAHQTLVYPNAGHYIGSAIPYLPNSGNETSLGGTPRANAAARADLWPKILRYLARL